jgi:DNA-binding PadR family transcriptional regulator
METKNTLINGWLNALAKKDIVVKINDEYEITEKGKELLFNVTGNVDFVHNNTVFTKHEQAEIMNKPTQIIEKQTLDEFSTQLHTKITAKIKELTGKNNIKNPSNKMLHSGIADFKNRLIGFFKKYKNVNAPFNKIETILLKYTEDVCNGIRKYPVTLLYYVWNEKNGGVISEMLEAIENLDDNNTETIKQTINIKDHF